MNFHDGSGLIYETVGCYEIQTAELGSHPTSLNQSNVLLMIPKKNINVHVVKSKIFPI